MLPLRRTPDEDDGLMASIVRATPDLEPTASITREARPGDDW